MEPDGELPPPEEVAAAPEADAGAVVPGGAPEAEAAGEGLAAGQPTSPPAGDALDAHGGEEGGAAGAEGAEVAPAAAAEGATAGDAGVALTPPNGEVQEAARQSAAGAAAGDGEGEGGEGGELNAESVADGAAGVVAEDAAEEEHLALSGDAEVAEDEREKDTDAAADGALDALVAGVEGDVADEAAQAEREAADEASANTADTASAAAAGASVQEGRRGALPRDAVSLEDAQAEAQEAARVAGAAAVRKAAIPREDTLQDAEAPVEAAVAAAGEGEAEPVASNDFEAASAGDDFEAASAGDDFEAASAGDDFEADLAGGEVAAWEDELASNTDDASDSKGSDLEGSEAGPPRAAMESAAVDALAEEMAKGSELGAEAAALLEAGKMVPIELSERALAARAAEGHTALASQMEAGTALGEQVEAALADGKMVTGDMISEALQVSRAAEAREALVEAIDVGSPIGMRAQEMLNEGKLVPEEMMEEARHEAARIANDQARERANAPPAEAPSAAAPVETDPALMAALQDARLQQRRAEVMAESALEDRARLTDENAALRAELSAWRDKAEAVARETQVARRETHEARQELHDALERLDGERAARARDSEAVRAVRDLHAATESTSGQWGQERAKLRAELRRLRGDAERHRTAMAAYASQAVPLKAQLDELVSRLCHESSVYGGSPAVVTGPQGPMTVAGVEGLPSVSNLPSLAQQLTPAAGGSMDALRELRARRAHAMQAARGELKLPSVASVKADGRYRSQRRPQGAPQAAVAKKPAVSPDRAATNLQAKRDAAMREISRIRRHHR